MNPMDSSITIFGDWGTSRLRLYLRQGKSVLDRRDGPGIGALKASPRDTFLDLVGDWREAKPSLALLCGMVGSRNGWQEAAYAPCPANAADIRDRLLHLDADGLPKDEAMGFLSGLLIGSDVAAAASWFGDLGQVSLIGAPALGALYAQAIAAHGGSSAAVDGDSAVLAGLATLSPAQNSGVHVLA